MIEFATSSRRDAARHLNHEQMDYLTQESKDYILDGVDAGICRVRDPHMYGGSSGVIPATNDRDVWDTWVAEFKKMHDRDWESRPQAVTIPRGDLPDKYEIEWGSRIYGDDGRSHIAWWGTSLYWEKDARKAGEDGYFRYIGPAQDISEKPAE